MGEAEMNKWCVDCRHAAQPEGSPYWGCERPIAGISPVTGEPFSLGRWCAYERVDPIGCGPAGKFWEQKA